MRRDPAGIEPPYMSSYQRLPSPQEVVRASKFLSLILRHRPETIGLTLDAEGWADIDTIVMLSDGRLTKDLIDRAVKENNKQRFGVSEDGLKIRARQGHSLNVNLGLTPKEPPDILYHGTHQEAVAGILRDGLLKMNRQHVHLAADLETARKVGARRGTPVVFQVAAWSLSDTDGVDFFLSENGVWLVDHVPVKALALMGG